MTFPGNGLESQDMPATPGTISREQFDRATKELFNQTETAGSVRVLDAEGRSRMADSSKIVYITPEAAEKALNDPDLRQHVVMVEHRV